MVKFLKAKTIMTAEEYLDRERSTLRENGGKHEFFNGKLIEIAGGTRAHNKIIHNCAYILETQIRQNGTAHDITTSETKVVSFLTYKNYLYPDVVIVNGTSIFADDFEDIVANPQILIEVLSDSTESFDRGEKFQSYRNIKYLQEYILISSDKRCIEQYYRDETGRWQFGEVISEGHLVLNSLPFELNIDEVYLKVTFN
jgi:Uma2 family endonuclease